jgi:hypothetical protein
MGEVPLYVGPKGCVWVRCSCRLELFSEVRVVGVWAPRASKKAMLWPDTHTCSVIIVFVCQERRFAWLFHKAPSGH